MIIVKKIIIDMDLSYSNWKPIIQNSVSIFLLFAIFSMPTALKAQQLEKKMPVELAITMQKRVPGGSDSGALKVVTEVQHWKPGETAIIICDMWNEHWCKGATSRVAEMAPRLNEAISKARAQGILIVHAPSSCINYYKDHPARRLVLKYNSKKYKGLINPDNLDSEKDAVWPIDQSDGGCNEAIQCKQAEPWRKQIDALVIKNTDAISDDGAEIAALFGNKGIKNVILCGVHTNMCVIGRTFGLRSMVHLGKNVVLMRDMTDAMYNSRKWPEVNHFAGVDLVVDYIETYVCPTILSTDLTGKRQFKFKDDKRPVAGNLLVPAKGYIAQRVRK